MWKIVIDVNLIIMGGVIDTESKDQRPYEYAMMKKWKK